MSEPNQVLSPLEYMVYGVLCAAKRETGPDGARRLYRIQERTNVWDVPAVTKAIMRLIELGWVRQCDPIIGMIHYESAES